MKNYLVIHGHFYQPPREDPWTGLIYLQDSAAPYHDWNNRITKECYAANSASRILNSAGKIIDIVNNYQFLSFNFGPTLINWLSRYACTIYKKILEADRASREKNNGHGNAIAQAYNHIILPLAPKEDIRTQIRWGLKDFEHHFQRASEGMWLPETAVNYDVIDILIEEGIQFIILSPWQAEAVCPIESQEWKPLNGAPARSNMAYRLDTKNGSMAVFFYNHILAQGVSFEHYLVNADSFFTKIISFCRPEPSNLINIATDGEVYGHHEPFGDMCLAALSRLVTNSDEVQFTNYGRYLELYPPQYLVKLKNGEDGRGTSWSCTHGVSRWFKNCGCSTGGKEGWNQEWRTPLRKGLESLRDKMAEIYNREFSTLSSHDPMDVRNLYISVMINETSKQEFAEKIIDKKEKPSGKGLKPEYVQKLYRLLEGQKYILFSFTSCGWFFADITGIEAIQNLRYSLKAIELYQEFSPANLTEVLLKIVEKAKSNRAGFDDGRTIFKNMVAPESKGMDYPASIFILKKVMLEEEEKTYGSFELISFKTEKKSPDEKRIEHTGTIEVGESAVLKSQAYLFKLIENRDEGIDLQLYHKVNSKPGSSLDINLKALPRELLIKCTSRFSTVLEKYLISKSLELFFDVKKMFIFSKKIGIKPPPVITMTGELAINCLLFDLLSDTSKPLELDKLKSLGEALEFSHTFQISFDKDEIRRRISLSLAHQVDLITDKIEEKPIHYIHDLLELVRKGGIEPELTIPQNIIFSLLRQHAFRFYQEMEDGNIDGFKKLKGLIKIGSDLGIEIGDLKELIFTF
ncbi:MAG: DUF3536 domain-containing protein [Spirochaetota bacterium]